MSTRPDWYLHDAQFAEIWEAVREHTMTSPERAYALYQAVKYLVDRPLKGNIIESGVWRGGSAMVIALTLLQMGDTSRHIWLFDTFSGMPEPEAVDIDFGGTPAQDILERDREDAMQSKVWAIADLPTVKENLASTGYPMDHIHFVAGDIRETAAKTRTGSLALLRLDTDWYASTKMELENFWPRLHQHGILIVDDYGHWQGSQKAVDEYFDGQDRPKAFLQPIDYTGRLIVRSTPNRAVPWEARYDHIPEQLACPDLLPFFPNLKNTDPVVCKDPSLRKTVPHIWRTDIREKKAPIGVVSTEEAAILHAAALTRTGRRAVEIGSHFGWSTAHIAAAGVKLDAIDPAFGDPTRMEQVKESLDACPNGSAVQLWAGYSPSILPAVAATSTEKYGFAFIDGLHNNDGPLHDVKGLLPFLADDALVLFHDLTFPDAATAVRHLKSNGWEVRLYNTMQVVAAAWKKGTPPPEYSGDPNNPISLPHQLHDLLEA